MNKLYLGIDIGGTNIKSIVLNEKGEILEQGILPTQDSAEDPGKWKQNIIGLIRDKTESFVKGDQERMRCAISAPGLVNKKNNKIEFMPGRLSGLENYNWSEHLKREIYVINDAHSACLAEYESYYKKEIKNMLLLTLGTGVGGAAILEGKLYQGTIQRAGHFGHITVDHNGIKTMTNMPGSLEHAIGNFSVKERTHGHFNSTRELVGAFNAGDPLASYWWLTSVQKLSVGLASLINAFSPELIVLGGGITDADEALFKPLKGFMSLYEWLPGGHTTEIKKARYGSFSGAVGAAYFAKQKTN
jgi:glucokinase